MVRLHTLDVPQILSLTFYGGMLGWHLANFDPGSFRLDQQCIGWLLCYFIFSYQKEADHNVCLFFFMFLFFDQNIQFEDFVIFVLTCIHFED